MKGITAALQEIKGYSWVKVPYLSSIEQYVANGDAKALAKVTVFGSQGNYWGSTLAAALQPVDAWEDEDRRAVHVLAAAGFEAEVWQWLNRHLPQEKAGQDWHAAVARELEVGRAQASRLAGDTMACVKSLLTDDKPNSAGRYLLGLPEKEQRGAAKAAHGRTSWGAGLGNFTELLLKFAPERAAALAEDLLADKQTSVDLTVVAALLKEDKARYGPVIAKVIKGRKDTWNVFLAAQELHGASPKEFGDLSLEAARASLAGPPDRNNHGPVAEFMMEAFGQRALPDILAHFKAGKGGHWDDDILSNAVKAYGMDMLPAVQAALARCAEQAAALGKAKPGDYNARYQLQRISASRAAAAGHLITLNDGSLDQQIKTELEAGMAADDSGTAIAFLTLAGRWDILRVADTVWGLLGHKSKPVRDAAARTLARGGDAVVDRASGLLAHKKADVRMAAASLLATVATDRALAALEARLDQEDNDDVRDQMLLGLEAAWTKQGRKVGRKDVEKRIKRAGDTCADALPKWLKPEKLPELRWADGAKVGRDAVAYLLYRQSRAKEIRPDVEAKAMYDLVDRKTSGDFAAAVLDGFLGSKQDAADRWALTVACKLGDDRLVPQLAGQIRQWVDANRGKLAEYAVQALALLGSDAALLTVDAMAIRYRSKMKNVGKAAAEAFAGAAEALGITPDELGDRVVPWLGFEPGKPRVIECGSGKFEVSIGTDFKLGYKDLAKNKAVKSLPKSCPAEVLKDLKEVSANLKEAVKAQLLRVENLLVRQRRWPVARWKELFLAHPLLLPFAVRLVWGHYDDSGKRLGLFRALEDRTLTDVADEAYEPGAAGAVGMVHPLELDGEALQAWRNHLADYEVEPPFPQMERQVVRVAEADAGRRAYKDLAGKSLNAMTFKGRAERLGWHRGSVCDGGGITSYVKTFPTAGADVILGVEDFYIGIDMYSDMKLGEVMFVKSGSVTFGSYTYDEPSKEDDPRVLAFGQVSPIVFSEAMGDLERIAGKAAAEGEEE